MLHSRFNAEKYVTYRNKNVTSICASIGRQYVYMMQTLQQNWL